MLLPALFTAIRFAAVGVITTAVLVGCGDPSAGFRPVSATASPKGKERRAAALEQLRSLSAWPREELILLEEGSPDRRLRCSGETGGWVAAHQRGIRDLGYDARWNPDADRYLLVPPTE
ncbi:MAG: hypothetical protein AAF907_00995 [Planctomycetota bacterium]